MSKEEIEEAKKVCRLLCGKKNKKDKREYKQISMMKLQLDYTVDEIAEKIETLLQYIEELEKNNKFLKEWNDYDNEELRKRNGKARRILSKMKNVKEIDILNMGEEEVWNEIEKSFIKGSGDNDK